MFDLEGKVKEFIKDYFGRRILCLWEEKKWRRTFFGNFEEKKKNHKFKEKKN